MKADFWASFQRAFILWALVVLTWFALDIDRAVHVLTAGCAK